MLALLLAAAAAAAPPEDYVEVVILTKYAPKAIDILSGGCQTTGLAKDVVHVARDKDKVSVCTARKACKKAARFHLACREPARIRAEGLEGPRRYGPSFTISTAPEDSLRVVTQIPMEDYVAGVVLSEHAEGAPEAQRALAIVARTFAKTAQFERRHEDATVCDLTHCQVFRGIPRRKKDDPAQWTEGQYMARTDGRTSPVFFHTACGGRTRAASAAWPSITAPELVGIEDVDEHGEAWCRHSPHFGWVFDVGASELARALSDFAHRKLDPATLEIASDPTSEGSRFFVRDKTREDLVNGTALHLHLGRVFGWGRVKSNDFVATRAGKTFRFEGRGMGHSTGLCLAGADARARAGHTSDMILAAYFPKLHLVKPPPIDVQIESPDPLSDARKASIKEACESIAAAMGDRGGPWRVRVRQAKSADEFAERTHRPRFEAAATLNTEVWLQPEAVLDRVRDVPAIERHECVHAWLRRMDVPPLPRALEEAIAMGASGQLAHIPPQRAPTLAELEASERVLSSPHDRRQLEETLARVSSAIWPLFAHVDRRALVEYLRGQRNQDWLHCPLPDHARNGSIADLVH